jgi:hypothetical protein
MKHLCASNQRIFTLVGAIVIALLACILYLPFLKNGIVFDDNNLFTNLAIYDFATPFNIRPRTFPYFTLAFVEIQTHSIEVHRIVSLTIHILCAWVLYALLAGLMRRGATMSSSNLLDNKHLILNTATVAFIGAAWFAINPVAVYGAGYLAQRTILFATLFSLLSMWFYYRALEKNRTADVITAAVFYSAAVLSKEHAIMVSLATIAMTSLYQDNFRLNVKRAGLYLMLCLPAAIVTITGKTEVIGNSYEPDAAGLISMLHQIALFNHRWGQWLASILVQASLFFDYPGYWTFPDIRSMSADMRIDFIQILNSWQTVPKVALFFASPVAALLLMKRSGLEKIFACGLWYCWVLYLTELVSIRIQEPFVLYRSYIWAPGYALMFSAVCYMIPRRWMIIASIPVFMSFLLLARNRLESLATEGSVWMDAAAKLKSEKLIGSDRILYNQGLEFVNEKEYGRAIANLSRVIELRPRLPRAYLQRGVAYYSAQEFSKALTDLNLAVELNKKDGRTRYARAIVLEHVGCYTKAAKEFRASLEYGMPMAAMKIAMLSKKIEEKKVEKESTDQALCS